MKIENNMTNQLATRNFLKATMKIIAENTSPNYSIVVINGIKEQLSKEFAFLKNIHIKGKEIKVDETLNSINGKELKNFLTKIVDSIGTNYIKVLLARNLTQKEFAYLENL